MKKQPWCSFMLAGISLTEYGLEIPSPFVSLTLSNSEITSMTSWKLQCTVGGDSSRKVNIAAFEALIYGAAQAANKYTHSSGIPVSFAFGWQSDRGEISEYVSYQGFTLNFQSTTNDHYMTYTIEGFAHLIIPATMPVLHIPSVCGIVQASAVFEGLALATKATTYYELDIDHTDAPTFIDHGDLTTSFDTYTRGQYDGTDNYDQFPGLVVYSKSYNLSRDAGGLKPEVKKLTQVVNNVPEKHIQNYLTNSIPDDTVQCTSYTYWVDEPTMTTPGVMHYKSNANLANMHLNSVLEWGTSNTNILSISGSYKGTAYNMTNFDFTQLGFALDGSGNSVVQDSEVVNSWSSTIGSVFQTVNIINDVNAIASQFSGDFTITIPGNVKDYKIAQPISLLIMTGNTISPVTGIYNIISVSHTIAATFITTLKIQRLEVSTANQVAGVQSVSINGRGIYGSSNSYTKTKNIRSSYKVDFGSIYPTFEDLPGNAYIF